MKIKILEFKAWQGNKVKVQSHRFHKGNWKVNPNFEMYKRLILQSPARFDDIKEYEAERNGI
jgi:hypothetical protein